MSQLRTSDATNSRYDVDVDVAIVFTAEGDECAVGREVRIEFVTDAGGETARFATGAGDDPEIAGVFEDDLRLAERRVAKEEVRGRLGEGGREKERTGDE